MVSFEEYCKSKKIDSVAFENSEAKEFVYLKNYFNQVSPESFTAQKLFLINALRRRYWKDTNNSVTESNDLVKSHNAVKNTDSNPANLQEEHAVKAGVKEIVKAIIPTPRIPAVRIPIKKNDLVESTDSSQSVLQTDATSPNNQEENLALGPKTVLTKPKIPINLILENDNTLPESTPKAGILKPKIPRK